MAKQKPKFPTKYIAFTTYFGPNHEAVDIPNKVTVKGKKYDNTSVYMTHDAKIITNSYASDYGYFIEYEYYENGNKFVVGDGHFNKKSDLKVGTTSTQGTFIATMGNTGKSDAVHDHHRLSKNETRVNPLDYEYVYPDQVVGSKETAKLMYYTPPTYKIKYRAHCQNKNWMLWVGDGETAGTTYQALRLEAIQIDAPCEVYAKAHIQNKNWIDYGKITKDTIIGTVGEALRLECLCLKGNFDYRVYMQNTGWTSWTYADGICTLGSVGQALRIEAIQIKMR